MRASAPTRSPLGQQGEPWAANGRPQRVKIASNIRCHSEPVRLSGVGIPRIEVKAAGLGSKMFENSGGLPRQCAHCLAMTWFFDSLRAANGRPYLLFLEIWIRCAEHHLSGEGFGGKITGRENPALFSYFSTTGGWSGDRWSPHPDSRCPGATGQYWRCPGKRQCSSRSFHRKGTSKRFRLRWGFDHS